MKFNENPSSENRGVPCRRTDGHDEANTCFCNFENAPKNSYRFRVGDFEKWVSGVRKARWKVSVNAGGMKQAVKMGCGWNIFVTAFGCLIARYVS